MSSMGIGVGTMLMAPLAGYIVKHYGWRNGFLLIGLLMLSMGILISYFFMVCSLRCHEPLRKLMIG